MIHQRDRQGYLVHTFQLNDDWKSEPIICTCGCGEPIDINEEYRRKLFEDHQLESFGVFKKGHGRSSED